MPSLKHIFKDQDLNFVKICAQKWNFEIKASDKDKAISEFLDHVSINSIITDYIDELPENSKDAFEFILQQNSKFPSRQYLHQFGEIRIMGPARRDREKPYLNPVSPAEDLWYRAIIGNTFLKNGSDLEEFFFIPDEILKALSADEEKKNVQLGEAALPETHSHIELANDRILDHMCTILSSFRNNRNISVITAKSWGIPFQILVNLFQAIGLTNSDNQPVPELVKKYLEAARGQALSLLFKSWLENDKFNELRQLQNLVFEGNWENNPIKTRQIIIDYVKRIPKNTWWSIPSFINAIFKQNPDFQRSAGEYDSWYIRKANSKKYLHGISSWKDIEGRLIEFYITGPLHWLGLTDLGSPLKNGKATAFRLSKWSHQLINDQTLSPVNKETEKLSISSNGSIFIPPLCSRTIRYQISRFCEWQEEKKEYSYFITPSSLENARGQGLPTKYLLQLIESKSKNPVPPNLKKALYNWEQKGNQINIETNTVLEADSPEIIEMLNRSNTKRFIIKKLNPTTIVIKDGGRQHIQNTLAENGYLVDILKSK